MKFAQALPTSATENVYGAFDAMLEIMKERQVVLDDLEDTREIFRTLRESLKSKFCVVYALDELVGTPLPHRVFELVCNGQPSYASGNIG